MRPKIAHVLSSLHVGGAELVARELAARQVREGYRVVVVSLEEPPDGPLAAELAAAGVDVQREPKGAGFDASLPPRLWRRFRREGIDLVHTHNPLPLMYAAVAGKLAGAAVVHTKHGPHPDRPLRIWLRRAGAAAADRFVAVSQVTADYARSIREVSAGKLRVVPNGTDLGRFRPDPEARARVRAELGVAGGAFVVGTVGRMAAVKNHALLVRALAPVVGPGCRLVIVGDGGERARTAALVEELGLGAHVSLLGQRRDVAALLAGFDLFVMSSDSEGLPLVLPEAMACGLPVVATAVGGIPEVIAEGDTGHLVAAGDEAALRERIAALVRDPAAARAMGGRAREVAVTRYSAERMAADYLRLYEEALGRR